MCRAWPQAPVSLKYALSDSSIHYLTGRICSQLRDVTLILLTSSVGLAGHLAPTVLTTSLCVVVISYWVWSWESQWCAGNCAEAQSCVCWVFPSQSQTLGPWTSGKRQKKFLWSHNIIYSQLHWKISDGGSKYLFWGLCGGWFFGSYLLFVWFVFKLYKE